MRTPIQRLLYWTPRIFCLLFAAFLSLFALDVLGEGHGFWGTLVALSMHLIPTFLLLAVLAVAWRWEWVGGLAFTALAIYYVASSWGRFHWSTYVLIAGPLLVLGALFTVNWVRRAELRSGTHAG